jgi:hypothetical protein
MTKIKLGDKIKDTITGLEGIAIAKIEFLNGCVQYEIQPPVDKEGKMIESEYVDSQQIEKVKEPKPPKVKKAKTGGGYRKYPE